MADIEHGVLERAQLLTELCMSRTELRARAAAEMLSGEQARMWGAVQTWDYLIAGGTGKPPSFGAWLLAQEDRGGAVGCFAREYADLSTCILPRTPVDVREMLTEIGLTPVGSEMLTQAEAEYIELAQANGWISGAGTTGTADTPHALYRFFAADGLLLYIGLTMNPGTRWKAHSKEKPWWLNVAHISIEHFPSRAAVEAAEIAAIRAERPMHNVVHNRPVKPVRTPARPVLTAVLTSTTHDRKAAR